MQADLCNLEDAGPCSGEYWAILLLSFEESLSPPTDPINLKFSPRTNEPTYPRATTRHDAPRRALEGSGVWITTSESAAFL